MPLDLKVARDRPTLRELALDKMHEAILSFRFRPGDRLVERDLCEQLNVSRSVVREVLRHLESEGLVETVPQRGPIVAKPTPGQADQIYEVRALLEALAARGCAEARDGAVVRAFEAAIRRIEAAYREESPVAVLAETNEFYRILFEAGGKEVAWSIVRSLNARINHLRAMTIATSGRARTGVAELKRIVEAIKLGDGDKAHQACIDHVGRAAAIARDVLDRAEA